MSRYEIARDETRQGEGASVLHPACAPCSEPYRARGAAGDRARSGDDRTRRRKRSDRPDRCGGDAREGGPERAPHRHLRRPRGSHPRRIHPHPRVDRFPRRGGAALCRADRAAARSARDPRRRRPAHPLRSRGAAPRGGARRRALERPARPRRRAPRRGAGSKARRPRARIARGAVRHPHRGAPQCARRRPDRGRNLRRPDPEAARGRRTHPRRGRGVCGPPHRARPPRGGGGLARCAGRRPRRPRRPRHSAAPGARPYRQLPLPAPAR